jgi:fluoroquinolone resistance protein
MDLPEDQTEFLSQTFQNLDLGGDVCHGRTFEDCRFQDCNFSETRFVDCRFTGCVLDGCNLSVCRLDRSRFSDVHFDGCKLVGIDWTTVLWPGIALASPVRFRNCILNDSSFFGLTLPELTLETCKAHQVDFREGDFSGSRFCFSDLRGCLFTRTNLSGADFTDAIDYDIDVNLNTIRGARFSRLEAVRLLEHLGIELVD